MASTDSKENLINSRLKMFQTVSSMASSSSKPPPPLPIKPNKIPVTSDQAKTAAKFVQNNVKTEDVVTAAKFVQKNVKPQDVVSAAKISADIYGRNSDGVSKNYSSNASDAGKVLATAKLIQSMNNTTTTTPSPNFSPSKPLPPLPTIVKKTSVPNSKSSDFNRWSTSSTTNVKEISSKLQENLHTPPTVVRPQTRSKNDSFDQKSNSVKALRADLETKLNFGPPTVVYQNKRRSSTSNQDYNANLTSPTNFDGDAVNDDYSYNAYPRMLTTSPTTKSPPSQPIRPPPPTTTSHTEPFGIILYDFDAQHSDELSCKVRILCYS